MSILSIGGCWFSGVDDLRHYVECALNIMLDKSYTSVFDYSRAYKTDLGRFLADVFGPCYDFIVEEDGQYIRFYGMDRNGNKHAIDARTELEQVCVNTGMSDTLLTDVMLEHARLRSVVAAYLSANRVSFVNDGKKYRVDKMMFQRYIANWRRYFCHRMQASAC